MEFFRIVEAVTTEEKIQKSLTMDNLEQMSKELILLGDAKAESVAIGGLWGEFTLSRHLIKGGLRFALVECPNALAWSVTTGYPPARQSIVIHLTINRQQKQKEFIDEIEAFLDDHKACLQKMFVNL